MKVLNSYLMSNITITIIEETHSSGSLLKILFTLVNGPLLL